MKLPKLYKMNTRGSLEVWCVETLGNHVVTIYGDDGGKLITKKEAVLVGKHLGTKRETTPEQQASGQVEA